MAVTSTKITSKMSLTYKAGINEKGEDILKTQSFSQVKVSAAEQDLMDVGQALGGLLLYPLVDLQREDISSLSEV